MLFFKTIVFSGELSERSVALYLRNANAKQPSRKIDKFAGTKHTHMIKWGKYLTIISLLLFSGAVMAQEEDDFRTEEERKADEEAAAFWDELEDEEVERKGFYAGIYVGALKADSYSARLYDGYGFDQAGQPNNFTESFMYRQIIEFYGNFQAGGGDQIAQALGVGPGEWIFDESDMPTNLTYNLAFAFGLQGRYNFDNKNALLFNINFSQLTINGQFTIEVTNTQPISDPSNPGAINFPDPIKTFGIRGDEQRVMLQAGYQRVLGNSDFFNWVVEGGVDLTFAKFDGNQAQVNDLVIDLTTFYHRLGVPTMDARNLTGVAAGVFGGFGGQIEAGGKWTIQLLYNPIYQKIALGFDTRYGLHHTMGLRAIYNI